MQVRTLRAGILVSLKTHVRGGTRRTKRDIELPHTTEDGSEVSRYEATKIVFDPVEQKAATQAVGKAAYQIRRLCAETEHGLLCLEDRADELAEAIAEARAQCDAFNATAIYTRIEVNTICGRVIADDVEATRALFSETERFLEQMQEGLKELNAEKVRALARKALKVGQMLSDDANATVVAAVKAARAEATRIVAAGEQVAFAIDQARLDTIGAARNAFLDFDMDEVEIEAAPMQGRALDFEAAV